ncbi:hypothetical protein ES705_15061 [subsurface metagenome]
MAYNINIAVSGTIKIMKHIDEVIVAHGGWPMKPGEDGRLVN